MKMTDESALADVRAALEYVKLPLREGQAIWDAAIAGLNHLAARLAADQQKGGGEVVGYLVEKKPHVVNDVAQRVFYFADEQNPSDPDWWLKGEMQKYTVRPLVYGDTPQPSITAPAQQDGKASGGVVVPFGHMLLDKHGNCVDFRRYTDDGQYVFDAAEVYHRDACVDEQIGPHSAVLVYAHPPHADQETQG